MSSSSQRSSWDDKHACRQPGLQHPGSISLRLEYDKESMRHTRLKAGTWISAQPNNIVELGNGRRKSKCQELATPAPSPILYSALPHSI